MNSFHSQSNSTCLKLIGDKGKELILKEGENIISMKDLMNDQRAKKETVILTIYLINYKSALIRTYSSFPVIIYNNLLFDKETYHHDSLIKYDDLKSIQIIPYSFKKSLFVFREYEPEVHLILDSSTDEGKEVEDINNSTKPSKLSSLFQSFNLEQSLQSVHIKDDPLLNSPKSYY